MELPKKYTDLVGTRTTFFGGLFSGKINLPEQEYDVLDIRISTAQIVNYIEMKETGKSSYRYPAFELLLKNETMKRSKWTRSFAIREINLLESE